jgi:hypothetical protein
MPQGGDFMPHNGQTGARSTVNISTVCDANRINDFGRVELTCSVDENSSKGRMGSPCAMVDPAYHHDRGSHRGLMDAETFSRAMVRLQSVSLYLCRGIVTTGVYWLNYGSLKA